MKRVSAEVSDAVSQRFRSEDRANVLADLASLSAPPASEPKWARARARVQLALVLLANGDAAVLRKHLVQAELDWRDTLCNAGLENADWPSVLRKAGYPVPP